MPLSFVCLDESEDFELRFRKGTFDVASFLSQTWERRQYLLFKTKLSISWIFLYQIEME